MAQSIVVAIIYPFHSRYYRLYALSLQEVGSDHDYTRTAHVQIVIAIFTVVRLQHSISYEQGPETFSGTTASTKHVPLNSTATHLGDTPLG